MNEYIIDDLAYDMRKFLIRWGRVNVMDAKEKWGDLRLYVNFGWYSLHNITHPGHAWIRYPKWLHTIDVMVFSPVIQKTYPVVAWYHKKLYRMAYKNAVKKHPELKERILCCADYPELLQDL